MHNTVTLDFETTTANKGHPFTPSNYPVSYSIKVNNGTTTFHYFTEPDFLTCLRSELSKCNLLVCANGKFELLWLFRLGIRLPADCDIFDVLLAEHIITGQEAVMASLDEVLSSYGLPPKQDKVKEYWSVGVDTPDIPKYILEEYNNTDVENTYELFNTQVTISTAQSHKLILVSGKDTIALAEAEFNGIKFNQERANQVVQQYGDTLLDFQQELATYLPVELPETCKFNWDSGDQLSCLLYGGSIEFEWRTEDWAEYKSGSRKGEKYLKGTWHSHVQDFPKRFNPLEGTKVKKSQEEFYTGGTIYYQVDDPTLKQLKTRRNEDKRLLEILDKTAKLTKVISMIDTFNKCFRDLQWEDNMVHGQFNQNIARTGRLSSSKPNLQNTSPEVDQLLVSRYD